MTDTPVTSRARLLAGKVSAAIFQMNASRARLLIAIFLIIVVAGVITALVLQAAGYRPKKEFTLYKSNFSPTVLLINTRQGVYADQDYYVATSADLGAPENGQVLINPIRQLPDEQRTPQLEAAAYSVTKTSGQPLKLRLSNSARSEVRAGQSPEVAYLGIALNNSFRASSQPALLYNNNSEDESVDSALLFGSATGSAPTNWSAGTSLYILDGVTTNHAAALLPGLNITQDTQTGGAVAGVIYSTRSLAIGSIPSPEQDAEADATLTRLLARPNLPTDDAVAQVGVSDLDVMGALAMNTDLSIMNTDILLVAPPGKQTVSVFRSPAASLGATAGNSLSIEGGVIAVGERCSLSIETDAAGLGSVYLSPRALIVDGGELSLTSASQGAVVINSDIQVRNGGRLRIGENVTIKGNIYAFGGGLVEIAGSFRLEGRSVSLDAASVPGGIFILANNSFDSAGNSLGNGYFTANRFYMIEGSDGQSDIEIIKSHAVHFLSTVGPFGYGGMYQDYACLDSTTSRHLCEHFGPVENLTAPDISVHFSADFAQILGFMPASINDS
ncbi:MAG: hypothetical protein LBU07_00155 [Coriobacteriales bacterium]|jgi:hypothetical protein|nr:hypothetical protein [Coriobacteriales bacterium]